MSTSWVDKSTVGAKCLVQEHNTKHLSQGSTRSFQSWISPTKYQLRDEQTSHTPTKRINSTIWESSCFLVTFSYRMISARIVERWSLTLSLTRFDKWFSLNYISNRCCLPGVRYELTKLRATHRPLLILIFLIHAFEPWRALERASRDR